MKAQVFAEEWRAVLRRNVPLYRRLPGDTRLELEDLIKVFLDEKRFEGAGGLQVTDEMRVTVAAQACVLLLHRETDVYPDLETVIIYPAGYVDRRPQHRDGGVVVEDASHRLGESWSRGVVVLSWNGVLSGARDVSDGENLVFHEFAHQLDQEYDAADGTPELEERWMYREWSRVLSREFEALIARTDAGKRSLIDSYGATNPAEFFAVLTELFFERPHALKKCHPELYESLLDFYQHDPREFADG